MSYLIEAPDGKREYENRIIEDGGKYQWAFTLFRVDEWRTTNRGWRRVGPEFETRRQCARYLGWKSANQFNPTDEDRKHRDELIQEYNDLFADEPLEFLPHNGQEPPRMGRPSQGRSVRLQPMVTPELAEWLEGQKIHNGDKSVSDVVFKLLEEIRQSRFTPEP